ncbi:MAG: nucleoside triphosphate pyrophosphohydrolase [Clostridiaceae bacterium]|nr:nucleoside triphosphate pyrophosphohydrolase [Clostridiaceae bacterium]
MPDNQQRPLPPAESFVPKNEFTVAELLDLMAFLRSEQGCPWDREQTHGSLRQNLLEEAYEVIDAIESGQPDRLCDELGDVLMQVVFHAQMAAEDGTFTFSDVVTAICNKLISRHTHIFGPDRASTPDAVIANWEKNKKLEKGLESQTQVLLDVPRTLPALQRSYKVQQKAAQVGFDWAEADGPRQKIEEELAEIQAAPNQERLEDELGDLLFSAVNYARHLKVQPEMALNRATEKFIRRFAALEALAESRQLKLGTLPLAELDRLWDTVKQDEKGGDSHASR